MADESRARQLLRHTWHAFYGRFGRLRPIQRIATEPICRGRDVLVGAPTASGKTEAVVAPMLERILYQHENSDGRRGESGLQLMIVTPTRALARDLHRRLEGPTEQCGLRAGIKTGDTSSIDYDDLPNLLTTTPESLDSMLARHPSKLRSLSGMMLDELHLLDGSSRGDQLQCLLERVRQIHGEDKPQVCGASATLADGANLATTYLGADGEFLEPGDSKPEPVDNGQNGGSGKRGAEAVQRPIDAELIHSPHLEKAAAVIADIFRRGDARKLLVFANARRQVEELTALLKEESLLHDRVVSHHGSLSRAERLRAETKLRDAPAAVCVATMTLEVGIDIGDVDRSILVGTPPNVSSLLQRIGRSNRRDEVTHVTCLYDGTFEKLRMTHLLECASQGELFGEETPFRPTVVPQQALSLLFQNPKRWIDPGALFDRLPPRARRFLDRADCRAVLNRMSDDGVLQPMRRQRFAPAEPAEKMYEYGQIHSNIEDQQEVEVIDEMTRRVVGTVRFFGSHRQQLMEGDNLAVSLGGESREVVRMDDGQLVSRSRDDLEDEPQFIASRPPRYSRTLAQDFAGFLDVPLRAMVLEEAGDAVYLFHFLGTIWGRLYEQMLRQLSAVKRRGSHGAFFIALKPNAVQKKQDGTETIQSFFDRDELRDRAERAVYENQRSFMRLLGAGPNLQWLPGDTIDRWLRRAMELEAFVDLIGEMDVLHQRILSG